MDFVKPTFEITGALTAAQDAIDHMELKSGGNKITTGRGGLNATAVLFMMKQCAFAIAQIPELRGFIELMLNSKFELTENDTRAVAMFHRDLAEMEDEKSK